MDTRKPCYSCTMCNTKPPIIGSDYSPVVVLNTPARPAFQPVPGIVWHIVAVK